MSPNPYPAFGLSHTDRPEHIEKRIGLLIRLYFLDETPLIAEAIVEHINAILAAPGYISCIKQRCILRRLAAQWHCQLWIESGAQRVTNHTQRLIKD
ncbi:MAG: hypothetical protein methR_P0866 [Methyloprofundus sp.]|nr:MAG: hypothetical protein methR_P0866 [Methyloprofundus sp.]